MLAQEMERDRSEEVAAEVIEPEATTLEVTCTAATITSNMDALEAHVRNVVAAYEGAKYDLANPDSLKGAKADRAYLNGLKREIDERRKAVAREYKRPLDAFNGRCKAITGVIDEANDNIKAQLDQAEQVRKDALYARLEQHYFDYAGLLAPVVPYERLHESQWLNASFGEVKAQKALESKVSGVARDWEILKAEKRGMAHYEVAEREFFRTLSLSEALNAARRADEEDARIAELRAAVEPEPMPEPEPEPMPQPEPEPMPEPVRRMPQPGPAEAWTIVIPSAPRAAMEALAFWLKSHRIKGCIHRGTLAEVAGKAACNG